MQKKLSGKKEDKYCQQLRMVFINSLTELFQLDSILLSTPSLVGCGNSNDYVTYTSISIARVNNIIISASADRGPRYRVCAR